MTILFLLCLLILVYVYAGYPLACWLLGGLRRRSVRSAPGQARVSLLISAYNEVGCIEATVRNKFELDYPAELLEVVVVSDASDDGTDAVVEALAAEFPGRLRLIRQEQRQGKTAALNRAVEATTGDLIVFSDANSLYGLDALTALLAPFADPDVGYVTGRMLYRAADGSLTGEGCSTYMRYENVLRSLETKVGSVVGVAGGIDAVRRELYLFMRPDQQPDFVLPLSVVASGRRVVYAPAARLYENSLAQPADEFRMRMRVALRAWHALRDMAGLLNPFRNGIFAWQLFSHKWLRYLAPLFQAVVFGSNALIAGHSPLLGVLFLLQVSFYCAALVGYGLRRHALPTLLTLPYYLCLLNAAAGVAFVRFLLGHRQVTWTPRV